MKIKKFGQMLFVIFLFCCFSWTALCCSFGFSHCIFLMGFLHAFFKWFLCSHAAYYLPKAVCPLGLCHEPPFWHILLVLGFFISELLMFDHFVWLASPCQILCSPVHMRVSFFVFSETILSLCNCATLHSP